MSREIAIKETYLPTLYDCWGNKGYSLCGLGRATKLNGDRLTLNTNYRKKGYKPQSYYETPYNEIVNLDIYDKLPGNRKTLLDKQNTLDKPFNDIISDIKEALKGYIVKCWDSNKPKLFLHSAGYDSRIISGIITELREEKGEDWIGEIHFRCHQPEGDLFKQIMRAEGWRENQYSLWEDVKGNDDHYNLGRLEPVNGFMSFIQQYDFF